jgi:hypothetical protein
MASLVAFAAVLVAGSGCGYHVGSLVPSDIRTIYVPIFDNATFRRGLEFHLTEAVQRDIRRRTHLKLVGRDEADSILTGEIMDFRGALVVRDVNLRVIAEDVTISISFKWTERRTGRILAEASNVSNTVRLYAAGGETLGTATAESFRWLAEGIVDRMEGAW